MRHWKCPDCGRGKLAPERPRKDDVRRYCLKCSDKTGRLVERVCVTLERKRQDAEVARRVQAKKKRETAARARERSADERRERETVAGIHVPSLVVQYASRSDLWLAPFKSMPKVVVQRSRRKSYGTAHAFNSDRVAFTWPLHWSDSADSDTLCDDLDIAIDEKGGGYGPTRSAVTWLSLKLGRTLLGRTT